MYVYMRGRERKDLKFFFNIYIYENWKEQVQVRHSSNRRIKIGGFVLLGINTYCLSIVIKIV